MYIRKAVLNCYKLNSIYQFSHPKKAVKNCNKAVKKL